MAIRETKHNEAKIGESKQYFRIKDFFRFEIEMFLWNKKESTILQIISLDLTYFRLNFLTFEYVCSFHHIL